MTNPLDEIPISSSGSDSFLIETSASPSLAAKAMRALTTLSFFTRLYNRMRETEHEMELDHIHPFIWSIEKNEVSKNLLFVVGVATASSLMFSNSPSIKKSGMRIAAATLPIDFTTLLIGLLLRKSSIKYSFLFQLAGIGLAIFTLSAISFSFLSKGLKWIPVFFGMVGCVMLLMPIPDLIRGRRISEEKRDPERGE